MKKIKIISCMLLTILSCLKFATATEKNQSPIENAYEKTQNNQLEEEKEDEKLVENGASKKEILLENGADKEEILENGADKEEILKKEVDKKEILEKEVDKKEIFKKDDNKKAILKKDANEKKILNLPLQRFINMFEKEKGRKNNLIEQMCRQLEKINELIKNNIESFNDNGLFSDLEELKQNLLDYKEKISTNSNIPKDLENLAKKIYAYIDKLSKRVNSKINKQVENMYEQFRNFAYLDHFAKSHEYNNIALELNVIVPGVNDEVNALDSYISYIYCKYNEIKDKSHDDKRKIYGLETMKSHIKLFREVLKISYKGDIRGARDINDIVENKDRHNTARCISKACVTFIITMTRIAKEFQLYEIARRINKCIHLTYFTRKKEIDINSYKDVLHRFNVGMNYFEKHIDSNDQNILTTIYETKKRIAKTLSYFKNKPDVENAYKISSGFIEEIYNFFTVMSNYFRKNKKISLSDYVTTMNPLQDTVRDSRYATEVKASAIRSLEIIKTELYKIKEIIQNIEYKKYRI